MTEHPSNAPDSGAAGAGPPPLRAPESRTYRLRWHESLLVAVASFVLKLNGLSLRWEVVGRERLERLEREGRRVLFVFWHNRLLYINYALRRERLTMLVSRSRDGELIARAARWYGIESIRGSSSRGGTAAVRELARAMRERGVRGGITPDGPRGPRYVLQPGAVLVAKLAGASVVPVAIAYDRKKVFRSWDGFQLPYPLARAHLAFGEPLEVPGDADAAALERLRADLEGRLRSLTEAADARFGAGGRG